MITHLATRSRMDLASKHSHPIKKVNVIKSRFAYINTLKTIIVADLETKQTSEIPWEYKSDKKVTFHKKSIRAENPFLLLFFSNDHRRNLFSMSPLWCFYTMLENSLSLNMGMTKLLDAVERKSCLLILSVSGRRKEVFLLFRFLA